MSPGTIFLSSRDLLWLAAGSLAIVAVLLWRNYAARANGVPLSLRLTCAFLKFLGFAALIFCLLEPLWSNQRPRPGANLVAVVADNSQGLQIKDPGSVHTRGEELQTLLNPQHGEWLGVIEDQFQLRRYCFDTRLQSSRDFSELDFNGRATAIGGALRALRERFGGRPLAAIVLLTDGNATDLHSAPDLSGLPPIYPVVLGGPEAPRDIAVQEVRVSETAFEDAPVTVQADVAASGFRNEAIRARLLDATGKIVAEETQRPRRTEESVTFTFRLRPENPGLSFYRLEAGVAGRSTDAGEATLLNNERALAVTRGRGPYRILYVSGRPNWEFKFLNRALMADDQLQLTALIRVARREPRFSFLGRAGETSNPLFRGFGNQSPEDVERYDQPVLIRLNTKDEFELRGGFPKTPEELFEYQGVILDDLEAAFFSPDQAALLQKFVAERGGGVLMLGGMESFREGQYLRTPIGDMLPIYLDRGEDSTLPGPWHFGLTREGGLQPWVRLRDNEADERTRLDGMTPFHVLNRVPEIKPGASVLAMVTNDVGKTVPALVVQRYGRGRTAALTIGDMWRWGLHDPDSHRDLDKAWRQMVRWLVTDVPSRVELTANPASGDAAGGVNLQVRARDPKFLPLEDASVTLEIRQALGPTNSSAATNALRLRAEASGAEPGLYETQFIPHSAGGFQATATVTNATGDEVGRAVVGWSTDLAADEFRSLTPNVVLLEDLARRTGGRVLKPADLTEFAKSLPLQSAPIMEAASFPLWHTPAWFGAALVCLLGEWGIRRWKGLA